MDNKKLNERESLELISTMVRNARTNQRAKINSSILLLWGYVAMLVTLVVWIVKKIDLFPYSSLLWFLIPAICYPVSKVLSAKDTTPFKTYIDQLIDYVSILYTCLCCSLALLTLWISIPIVLPLEGMLFGMWAAIIGFLLKYKPIVYGGITGIFLSHIMIFVDNMVDQIPVFILIIIIALIIPAHLFKKEISKDV